MDNPTISVVVPTFNRRPFLPRIISGLMRDPYTKEFLVVVDGCDDGSMEYLESLVAGDPRMRPIYRANGGENAARQSGLDASSGDVVLFVDDDVLAGDRLAEKHAQVHKEVVNTVVLGYMPTGLPSRPHAGQFTTLLYAREYEHICELYEIAPKRILENFWAGNFSMRRTDALRVGMDRHGRLGFHDDMLFGQKCAEAGLSGAFRRELASMHEHSRTVESFRRQALAAGKARHTVGGAGRSAEDPAAMLPLHLRGFCRRIAVSQLYPHVMSGLSLALRAAGASHAWNVELAIGRAIRGVEIIRGYSLPI